jgi:hypothetical protein
MLLCNFACIKRNYEEEKAKLIEEKFNEYVQIAKRKRY